jgi:hypothetical protein
MWIICYVAFDLHVVSILSCSVVFCPKLGLYLIPLQCCVFVLWSVQVYPAVPLKYVLTARHYTLKFEQGLC